MFNLFKKKNSVNSTQIITKEMVLKVMESLFVRTKKEVINIALSNDECTIFDSKFGGLPYLPKEGKAPVSINNEQLRLIGQINLEQLPDNEYHLNKGMLQFWALNNDLYGLDFDDMTSQKESRVIYYPTIDNKVNEEDVIVKYQPSGDDYFPIVDTFKLKFEQNFEGISTNDRDFNDVFMDEWKHLYPDYPLESYYDLPEDVVYEDELYDFSGFGHKLFGYPSFTQEDPRSEGLYDDYILLLQVDSIGLGNKDIMWGDSGICNFFITKKDLEDKDFSKVLYNWDCF